MNRREFLGGFVAATALSGCATGGQKACCSGGCGCTKPEYHAFSRVFQFLKDTYKAAEFLKSCGYDGVEWTVRPAGFIEPKDAVAKLKQAKRDADRAGIKADNIVVSFLRGDDPGAEEIVMAAAEAGFKSFRGGYFRYDRAKTHRENMDAFRSGFDSLEALARKSGLKCCYQHHSTYNKKVPLFGSLVWDLASILPAYDPKYIGVQYDPMHIRAEGGPSWDHTLGAIAKWIDIVCLKDFHFALDKTGRDWMRVLDPAGKGIVDFKEVKRLMELEDVAPRFTVHYDYDFPEEPVGARKFASEDVAYYRSIFG